MLLSVSLSLLLLLAAALGEITPLADYLLFCHSHKTGGDAIDW
jgi:hypothetical protein